MALVGSGCSAVVRADRADARIYMEGEYIGTGMATTTSTGLPGTVVFSVEADGQRRENPVRREFRAGTFFVGLFTYMTGWLWCWQLPAEVSLLAPERRPGRPWQRSPSAAPNPWRRAVAPAPETSPAQAEAPAPVSAPGGPAAAPASTPWFQPN